MTKRNRGVSRIEREQRLGRVEPGARPGRQMVAMQAAAFSGPIPPPSLIREYNEASPGAGDLIIQTFKQEGDHRRDIESRLVTCEEQDRAAARKRTARGQILGFVIAVLGLSAAVALGVFIPPPAGAVAAGVVGGGTLGVIVTAFVIEKKASPAKDDSKSGGQAP